ncbi:zf-ZPR1-domain-containing protein [Trichodelitschia bisporula]|uniref:Zf-ZPR1-domain-containing protein n=1 Tax=Trichodelitschia bisporula TaxID=703511 RepID=A0A6G1I4I3_9PEZI|nr:zf-ZPR1-domain-containing protein [Trichodelitschia bisporula]
MAVQPPPNLATDLFEDMGRKVAEASKEGVSEDEPKVVDEIESLCMNCHENGTTRLLLTRIPFFREIIIMSFDCPECGFHNTEVQPAGEIQQRGHKFVFRVDSKDDLNRQVVKSDTCIFRVEDIDLEIPPGRGQLTNVEGIISMVASDLAEKQEERKEVVPEVYEKLEQIIATLKAMSTAEKFPFTISVDDPAGNSWIEPSPSDKGKKYIRSDYARTAEQNASLGLGEAAESDKAEMRPEYHATQMFPEMPAQPMVNNVDEDIVENLVYSFPATCPGCVKHCVTNMKMVNIPHFKQVVLMSTVCEHCGYRSNEVKTGGEVPEKGRRITVDVKTVGDLSRDILKAESCAMSCPELDLSVEPGTLGGRFTTIEGLLTQVRDDLHSSIFDAASAGGGDSLVSEERKKWDSFFDRLNRAIKGEVPFTLTLEDPLASSYVQSFAAPEPDAQMKVEEYERTAQEEEDLGLTDMKTEGYEADAKTAEELASEAKAEEDLKIEKAKKFLTKVTGADAVLKET